MELTALLVPSDSDFIRYRGIFAGRIDITVDDPINGEEIKVYANGEIVGTLPAHEVAERTNENGETFGGVIEEFLMDANVGR